MGVVLGIESSCDETAAALVTDEASATSFLGHDIRALR